MCTFRWESLVKRGCEESRVMRGEIGVAERMTGVIMGRAKG